MREGCAGILTSFVRLELCYFMGRMLARIEYSPYNSSLEGEYGKSLILIMVGTGRFELPTPRTPSECSTRLSHVPTQWSRLVRSRLPGS